MSTETAQLSFAQQLEQAAEEKREEPEAPTPPQRPPPRKTEGLGARAALNSLRNLGPVAQFVRWSQGGAAQNAIASEPETPRLPVTSSSQPNLPSVAKPPATPAPPSGGRRPSSLGRRSASATPTPREERAQSSQSARESSPSSLPLVRPATPTKPEAPQSARASTIRRSYQMTPREQEAQVRQEASSRQLERAMAGEERRPADGPMDSPVPRRPRSKSGRSAEVSQSAPAAPMARANSEGAGRSALSASSNFREIMEVQGNAQKLLEAVFEITITEEAAVSILDSYPELVWLANCLRRCPLPPGWTAVEAGQGRLKYVDMGTGASAETSPLMPRFADLGRLMLHWRQNPSAEADVAAALAAKRDQDLEDAARARKVWKGPHTDPKSGSDFWHCAATGRSTWGDPGMAAEFLARISDRLMKALPTPAPTTGKTSAEPTAPAEPAKSAEAVSGADIWQAEPDGSGDDTPPGSPQAKVPKRSPSRSVTVQDRPQTPLVQRQAEVREMMASLVTGKLPPADGPSQQRLSRPRPGTPGKQPAGPAPSNPQPPNAPRGPRSSVSEPTLTQVASELSE
ncbi:unnamed protein product, partial [Polarella glacialis]